MCAEAATPRKIAETTVLDLRCEYCGQQPGIVSSDVLAMTIGAQETRCLCPECMIELTRYIAHELETIPKELSLSDKREIIRGLRGKCSRHMKEWIGMEPGA